MKNKLIYLILILGIVIFTVGYNLFVPKGGEMKHIAFEISLQKSTYQLGAEIPVSVSLKNTGKTDVVINNRMSLNYLGAPMGFRDIAFNITGPLPLGNTVPFTARRNIRPSTPKDLVVLSSGETINKIYDIGKYYEMNALGSYKVFAIYQYITQFDKYDIVWKGELTSNSVIIEIIP